jgi:hypothetical protein
MRVGVIGLGTGGRVTNAAGAVFLNDGGSISVEKSSISNAGLIDNRGGIRLLSGGITNDGVIENGGTILVDCARLENNSVLNGNAPSYAYCWAGSSGAPWSAASNWKRNGVAATQTPDENARIYIQGGRVSLDVSYTLRGSLLLGGRTVEARSDLIVEPGVLLAIYGSVNAFNINIVGNRSSLINNSLVENYGSVTTSRLENNDTFHNHGIVRDVLINNANGSFENGPNGNARLALTNFSTITNAGTMKIGSTSGDATCNLLPPNMSRRCFMSYGSITNQAGASLDILQGLWIRDGGELNNYGDLSVTKRFLDVGGIVGPGLLKVDRLADVLHEGLITVGPIVQDNRPEIPGKIENSGRFEKNGAVRNEGSVDNQGHFCGRGPFTGNAPTGVPFVTICDTTPPVIVPNLSGTLGNEGWYTSDIVLSWTITDNGSQVFFFSGCNDSTITSDTTGTTRNCSAQSFGGRGEESVTYKRDATAPTLSPVVMPDPVMQGLAAIVVANVEDPPFGSGLATFDCGPVQTSTLGPQTKQFDSGWNLHGDHTGRSCWQSDRRHRRLRYFGAGRRVSDETFGECSS